MNNLGYFIEGSEFSELKNEQMFNQISVKKFFDVDDEGNSWKATYFLMRCPLPEA